GWGLAGHASTTAGLIAAARAQLAELKASAPPGCLIRRSLSQFLRELRSRGHVQLPERLAQVVFDGARADEELGGDLAVRVAIGRETRDLRLLRRELVERVGGPLSCMLARRLQFDPRALGEGV